MIMTRATELAEFERALTAERDLRAADRMVTALCAEIRAGRLCDRCAWSGIVKPLVSPPIGHERGYPTAEARDTERWLRTPEAWDAVTSVWLERLQAATLHATGDDCGPCVGGL